MALSLHGVVRIRYVVALMVISNKENPLKNSQMLHPLASAGGPGLRLCVSSRLWASTSRRIAMARRGLSRMSGVEKWF